MKQQFKRITTAAIASAIAWFVLEQTDISSLYKAVTYGIIGVVSPEVIGGLVKLGKSLRQIHLNSLKNEAKVHSLWPCGDCIVFCIHGIPNPQRDVWHFR